MVRVPLPFRGVAVLLLAATTVVGQTPEPPEFLSLDSSVTPSTPDFLRQFSGDSRHPLLSLMVDGELTSFEAEQAKDASKLKPEAKSAATAPKTPASSGTVVDGFQGDGVIVDGAGVGGGVNGGLDGGCGQGDGCGLGGGCGLGDGFGFGGGLGGGCGMETMCPSVPNMLPFACAPPPCGCRKCHRKCGHRHKGCGNAYVNWPCCPSFCCAPAPTCGRRCGHKHCGGCGNYGAGFGYGCGTPGYLCGGWMGDPWDDYCGPCGCFVPAASCGHKCHRRHKCCGGCQPACGGGYGGGYGGWGWDGGMCGGCMPAPQPCCGHKCHRRHSCANNYGYGYGYSGWDCCGYGYGSGYGCGCSKRHFGRCHRHCQQPCCYPMMPCMGGMSGMGGMSSMGWDSFGGGGMMMGDCGCDGTQGGMGY